MPSESLKGRRGHGAHEQKYVFLRNWRSRRARCRDEDCAANHDVASLIRDAQVTQSAQAGYSCDYIMKRQALAVQEAKEWQKSQVELAHELRDKPVGYAMSRVSKRLATDCYARGVCRGSVECANLIDQHTRHPLDPTRAESIKTAPVQDMSLAYPLALLEAAYAGDPLPVERCKIVPDARNSRAHANDRSLPCPYWTLYGERGQDARVQQLSAYEVTRHYHHKMARHPWTLERAVTGPQTHHAQLTQEGKKKLQEGCARGKILPGIDYRIQECGGADWIVLGTGERAQPYRHDWVLVPRNRPYVPVLFGAGGSRTEEEQAKKIIALFVPWTTNPQDATDVVPYIGDLRPPGIESWREALRTRVLGRGFPTEEVRRYVLGFCFVYCLPRELQPDGDLAANSDNEALEDVVEHLSRDDLEVAMLTHVRGGRKEEGEVEADERGGPSEQHELTKEMFDLSHGLWRSGPAAPDPGLASYAARVEKSAGVQDHELALQAAQASRSGPNAADDGPAPGLIAARADAARVSARPPVRAADVRSWLNSDRVRSLVNEKQHELLERVADRLLIELGLIDVADSILASAEPLVWLLHGGPGTGKTHVLSLLRELFQLLHYEQGLDYEITAFQCANASDLGGRTLHNACGLSLGATCLERDASRNTAKRLACWRWLIVDEISMVCARLLAQVDHRLRAVVPEASEWKKDATGAVRPFAGINVLFLGDFHQLPPPDGGYLADAPANLRGAPAVAKGDLLAEHGRNLLWSGPLQGVTELVERERCKDAWWNEVVDEFRQGRLSEANYRYLHGDWVDGCTLSAAERASRCRLISGPEDPRLQEPKFRAAVAIVANNDARAQINKDRARAYCEDAETPLRLSVARDRATSNVLQTEACDKAAKVRWLQYHDRDTGDLCGMLPLAVGMPVALTQHLDRSKKALLKGRIGHVHSWIWPDNEQQPQVVYVKFEGAEWQLDGTSKPGLYPAVPVRRPWFLDKNRPKPALKVRRTQIPLVPAFAITAHSSQGKTMAAVLLDLCIHKSTNSTLGTVAVSRVRSREDVLLLRRFPRWLFNRGAPEGPTLLLQTLRGHEIDWAAYRDARRPKAKCQACHQARELDCFAHKQWERVRANLPATCHVCAGGNKRKFTPGPRLECSKCGVVKVAESFPRAQLAQKSAEAKRQCLACVQQIQTLTCVDCEHDATKPAFAFDPSMLTLPDEAVVCLQCQARVFRSKTQGRAGWFTCRGACKLILPTTAASDVDFKHCLNCASQCTWEKDLQTCRSCNAKFKQKQAAGAPRVRMCPACRSRSKTTV